MYDGIKVNYSYVLIDDWVGHPMLEFCGVHSQKTGEIKGNKAFTKDRGLLWRLAQSQKDKGVFRLSIQGALPRFLNGGKIGYEDLSISGIRQAVALLEEYGVKAEKAILEGLEFGFNISLPYSASKVIKGFIALENRGFASLLDQRKKVGVVCAGCEYDVKVYDKSKVWNLTDNNLLRVEIKVKKMRVVQKYGVRCLDDLTKEETARKLLGWYFDTLNKVLHFDSSFKLNGLLPLQIAKLERWKNPNYWAGIDKHQRYYQRKRFDEFKVGFGGGDEYTMILEKLREKGSEKGFLCSLKNTTISPENNTLSVQQNCDHFTVKIKGENVAQALSGSRREVKTQKGSCHHCKKELVSLKQRAKFCNPKCRRKHYYLKYKAKQRKEVEIEKGNLLKVKKWKFENILLKAWVEVKREPLQIAAIDARMSKGEIWRVKKVEVYRKRGKTSIVLHTLRAKDLLRWVQEEIGRRKKRFKNQQEKERLIPSIISNMLYTIR
ncbi:hypothetical protein AAG747_06480 [Rapidithrix thailandica]|uniref:Uncharacterized protein n=1 Tax=Rapidithrix thailandica TaxID=413964 RepID=A0AAW9S557_9BACT